MKKTFFIVFILSIFTSVSALAFTTTGFQEPYGVVVDEKDGYIYVSNMNGGYDLKNGNGFISRLNMDGTVDEMRYIGGASKGKTLHSPKGMEVVDGRLYVADIDKLHVYELKRNKFIYNVNFGDFPVKHLVDVALGPDGALYVTDSPGNAIYRIDVAKQHEVTLFASGDILGQPHGICWYPARQIFIVAGWGSGQLTEFDRSGKRQILPSIFLSGLEGCVSDNYGNIYVSSKSLGTVFRITSDFALFGFALGQLMPAGLAFHTAENSVIVASLEGNTVKAFPAEKP